jgi:uncharacterized protein with NAD-binding domain and iron-sulfur cluster
MAGKCRVAVLGGGLGAISAAYALTTEALRDRYEVTVYTEGWRLGGKGASGRNLDPTSGLRIEEHGLHAFMGFYQHAFDLVRAVYGEWQKKPENPFRSWSDAFKPRRQVSFGDWDEASGRWKVWNIEMPVLPGQPGGSELEATIEHRVHALLDWLAERLRRSSFRERSHAALDDAISNAAELKSGRGGAQGGLLDRLAGALREVQHWIGSGAWDGVLGDELRRLRILLEIGCAAALGIVVDVLPSGDLWAIDRYDFKEWLERHGAGRDASWSSPVRALYSLGFAFYRGLPGRDNGWASAAVCLRVGLELLLGSRGAPLWMMQAGMGDTIFSPLYEVLVRQRNVKVEFFRSVRNLGLSEDQRSIDRIDLVHQVGLAQKAYDPLIDVRGLPCWPSEPHWDQIVDGAAIAQRLKQRGTTLESPWCEDDTRRRTLRRGQDFDLVVLGIPVGALPAISGQLVGADKRWRDMTRGLMTVQTQAFQVWLNRPLAALGWPHGPTVMTAYAEPFDTWGEMTQLIPREDWSKLPADEQPQSIHYFCSALPEGLPETFDPDFAVKQNESAKSAAIGWLKQYAAPIWPATRLPGPERGFDWSLLVDPEQRQGVARFDAQYWRANVEPWERYVLSVPGSARYRLEPGSRVFENLFLAGDWTKTSYNAGCAEGAIESGLLAAQAIDAAARFG